MRIGSDSDDEGRPSSSNGHYQQEQYFSWSSSSEQLSLLLKFKTAYADIEDRRKRRILSFDIEKIDSSISLSTANCLCIVDSERERKYANALLMRLCVRASLLSTMMSKKEQSELLEEEEYAKKVIFIDAGGGKSSSNIYQCVYFARQYGLDIKKVLRNIMVTRAFTIYQLADLIIYQLPKFIHQQFNGKVIVVFIANLLDLFTQNPNIDRKEGISLLKEIVNSIKKTLESNLVVVSFQPQQHNTSYAYHKILLPRFDKCIEITNNNSKSSKINLLDVKVYNSCSKDCIRSLLLEERDLLQIIPDPTS
jgi:hypothetical protein